MNFFIPCNPPKATSQQKGAFKTPGGIRFFKKKHVKQAEDTMLTLLLPYRPTSPITGPVRLDVKWVFPYRKSEKKSQVKAQDFIPCDTRPDLSNIIKMLEDALVTLCFIEDDGKVFSLNISKHWGPAPGIHISITPSL